MDVHLCFPAILLSVCLCCYYVSCAVCLRVPRDDTGLFGRGQSYGVTLRKVEQIQQKIEGWEVCVCVCVSSPLALTIFFCAQGPDILSCCTKLVKGTS